MKKGTFLTNLLMLISVAMMYLGVIYTGDRSTITYISLFTLSVISVIIFGTYIFGLNKISQIIGSFKTARKKILGLYVKDPDYVWEELYEEKFVFKNSILDGEFNSFKKEMNRLEDEGSIYCQADISDYVNEKNLFTRVKKNFLDCIPKVIFAVGMLGVMLTFLEGSRVYVDNFNVFSDNVLLPCAYVLGYTTFLSVEFLFVYRLLLSKMSDKCSLFVSDFYKFVVPCAKNDMANNILYLQQLQMQNEEKLSDNMIEVISDKLNDTMIRQSEKFTELSRQIECMTSTLNRFNEGVDELTVNIKDMIENERVLSKNQVEVLKDCLAQLEKKVDAAVEEKTAKKTTRKRTTKAKKEEVKVEDDKIENIADAKKTKEEKEEVVVEVAPVRKKRGRKSKAEKEAELKAAMEQAMKEANKVVEFKPQAEEEVKVEETPQAEEEVKVEEVPQTEEEVKVEEASQTEEEVKVEEAPQTEEEVKVEEAPQLEEEVKVEEAPQAAEEIQIEE